MEITITTTMTITNRDFVIVFLIVIVILRRAVQRAWGIRNGGGQAAARWGQRRPTRARRLWWYCRDAPLGAHQFPSLFARRRPTAC